MLGGDLREIRNPPAPMRSALRFVVDFFEWVAYPRVVRKQVTDDRA